MAKDQDFEEGDEETIYDSDGREDMIEDDELSASEEGFMRGYEEADEEKKKEEEE